jgi:MscS family membrane protein
MARKITSTQLGRWFEHNLPVMADTLAGHPLWVWAALVLAVPLALLVAGGLTGLLQRLLRLIGRLMGVDGSALFVAKLLRPVRLLAAVKLFALVRSLLPLSKSLTVDVRAIETFTAVYASVWILFRLVDYGMARLGSLFREQNRTSALAILPLLSKLSKTLLGILALLFLLQNFGFDVAAIIAGLGIGGIAIALASQKSVENLLGGVMLVLDQPVRVGEFCRFGTLTGTVEDVGLRSTRVRGLDRVLVTIPNAEFSNMVLENFSLRDKNLLLATLGIRYETTADQLEALLPVLRDVLLTQPDIDATSARVRFVGFSDLALRVEVFAFVLTDDWNHFLAVREAVFLAVMRVVQQHGVGFAFPVQPVVPGRDHRSLTDGGA